MNYINPDILFGLKMDYPGEGYAVFTFIYEPRLGLTHRSGETTHVDLLYQLNHELNNKVGSDPTKADPNDLELFKYVDKLYAGMTRHYNDFIQEVLMGRAAFIDEPYLRPHEIPVDIPGIPKEGWLVSFWNDYSDIYAELLTPCMIALYDANLIQDPVAISTPVWGTKPYSTAETTKATHDPTPPINKQELQRQREVHLLRGDEKKREMEQQGLEFGGKKNDWQAALEKRRIISPGQKWWAPTSESKFERDLNKILRQIRD